MPNMFFRSFRVLYITVCIIMFSSCNSSKKLNEHKTEHIYTFDFMINTSLAEVIDRAAIENKLVFVDVYAEWCLPCKMMDEDVFTDERLGSFFNDNFISLKVDGEKAEGPDIAFLYGINAYPTLLFLDHKGRILEKKVGSAYHSEMRRLAMASLEKKKEM